MEEELGDALFALVNLARHSNIDAEAALRGTIEKFTGRFSHVESRVRAKHGGWPVDKEGRPSKGLTLAELDGYWEEAKAQQKAQQSAENQPVAAEGQGK
jgi:uncharacterized protein YabN with tetrapyrrole methylase and pyrophosphatase domain